MNGDWWWSEGEWDHLVFDMLQKCGSTRCRVTRCLPCKYRWTALNNFTATLRRRRIERLVTVMELRYSIWMTNKRERKNSSMSLFTDHSVCPANGGWQFFSQPPREEKYLFNGPEFDHLDGGRCCRLFVETSIKSLPNDALEPSVWVLSICHSRWLLRVSEWETLSETWSCYF